MGLAGAMQIAGQRPKEGGALGSGGVGGVLWWWWLGGGGLINPEARRADVANRLQLDLTSIWSALHLGRRPCSSAALARPGRSAAKADGASVLREAPGHKMCTRRARGPGDVADRSATARRSHLLLDAGFVVVRCLLCVQGCWVAGHEGTLRTNQVSVAIPGLYQV